MAADRHPVAEHLSPLADDVTVSVIIPARHAAHVLANAVGSALAQQPPVDEVIVAAADEATTAAARRLAEGEPRVRVVANPEGGTSAALNRAVAAASGDVLVRLDTHAVLPDGYVADAVSALRATGAANVGGRQDARAPYGFARAVAAAMRSLAGAGGAAYRTGTTPGPADTVYLGVFRRDALDVVGGFDERFERNQDAELNERLRRHGFTVWFDPGLVVAYHPRSTVRALARQYGAYGRWRRATARMHRGSLRLRQLAAPMLVVGLVLAAALSALMAGPWPVVLAVGGYFVAVFVAGIHAADRPADGLRTAVALATMHLAWGIGFLVGPPRVHGRRLSARRDPPSTSSP